MGMREGAEPSAGIDALTLGRSAGHGPARKARPLVIGRSQSQMLVLTP